ncbi:clustered-asparagine-rich protein, putative [Plasmodium knowlesi strain H]|uniref:Clustered-asparagine-rich protein, putative n=3 Tax=Plasmodium knowlesi TaxID=5850 RepID=A0A5K1UG40_PLAKH|nr:clustered-asparagine-rich protein, putative [Plasmodium knowlesi strain H]OTN63708.1 putative Clustered-asparagine-rich protein [Plasmodium knowlesi]CAA9991154.1 clustered-asparagine-rich protein, putative [Plasmodium knowlesi strain H]SBO27125.1 clustered-asparagine-rich protein, putative [Plasmodium knowlesi strain H]SBO29362.1 clustered-asparagine-rich protein, putative [Plasmodium knowlesi strain H]VVS80628.1 clustered-asparagine-rich protein, putative [Plasmodium knowlesi strain H]|eukprot:XP_002262447.1 Clustered-asparagine-rich protein, putative [Plasmodium knowlesi strain H]
MSEEIPNATIDGVPNDRLHIQNIPPHLTESHLRNLFGNAGYTITDVCYFNKNRKQSNNGFMNRKVYNTALITFNTHEEALSVLKNIKSMIDTSRQEKSIEAKFAVPNVNNNSGGKNNNSGHGTGGSIGGNGGGPHGPFGNMGSSGNNNFQKSFNNNDDFNGGGMNNYNYFNTTGNVQGNLATRNMMKGKNPNNGMMMMMNNVNNTSGMNGVLSPNDRQMNGGVFNQKNNFMLNNSNLGNGKSIPEMVKADGEFSPRASGNIGDMHSVGAISGVGPVGGVNGMNGLQGEGVGSGNHGNAHGNAHGGSGPAMFRQMQNNNNGNVFQSSDPVMEECNENIEGLSLWEIYKDKNNNTYYYNNLTKHSQWNKPVHPNKLFHFNNNDKTKLNGPNGSNLFIFHIPSEWTDLDLFQHFCCFGNIISSKIQRDNTGRNSGFGFVSYDNILSAQHAIQFMNGYFVNNKYLKVQLKKGEGAEKA